jgi:hypothetical protein
VKNARRRVEILRRRARLSGAPPFSAVAAAWREALTRAKSGSTLRGANDRPILIDAGITAAA